MTPPLPTLSEAKAQAKTLRAQLAEQGQSISHANALERVAKLLGFRDWNTLSTVLKSNSSQWQTGGRVRGTYLGQPFTATIHAVKPVRTDWTRIALDLDDPVDVVTFDSFSALRKRVNAVIGPKGHTQERTSNGAVHVQIYPL